MLKKCSRNVPEMFQGWSKILPKMFQIVPKLFQKCSKDLFGYCGEVYAMLKKCSRHVPDMFQTCSKGSFIAQLC